jgi:hypothetical protein
MEPNDQSDMRGEMDDDAENSVVYHQGKKY